MIDTLSAEELDQLEAILGKPLDEKTELQMIQAELQQLGMDPQDVQDMFDLSEMMKKLLLMMRFEVLLMSLLLVISSPERGVSWRPWQQKQPLLMKKLDQLDQMRLLRVLKKTLMKISWLPS